MDIVIAQRIRTCEFHYKQSVPRHAKYLDPIAGETFQYLANQMLEGECKEEWNKRVR